MQEGGLSEVAIGSAIEVYRVRGRGLPASVYQRCLGTERGVRGIAYREQVPLAVEYEGERFEAAYRLDRVVNDRVVVELKAMQAISPAHQAQPLSYLRLAGKATGLVVNFHVPGLRSGIRRVVNNL